MKIIQIILCLLPLLFLLPSVGLAGTGNTSWMTKGKYGIFMHYQYRILLGYSVKTDPMLPDPSLMTAEEWNRFVDGFDVKGFAAQMAEAQVGWVLFCIDDHFFAWPCTPNKTFSDYTGYASGEKCSRRDLIMEVADALNAKGVKLICYFAGLNGYMNAPQVAAGLSDGTSRGFYSEETPPSAESRRRRLEILKEYADRYKDKIAGWWFDCIEPDTYRDGPDDWWKINSIVRTANPSAVIAFSHGSNEFERVVSGIDDYTAGDTWSKQDLKLELTRPLLTISFHALFALVHALFHEGFRFVLELRQLGLLLVSQDFHELSP